MSRVAVKIRNWPFPSGKKVKLMWIGEPFKHNNKWMVNTYFKLDKTTRKIILDWASIHFLSVGKYYTDGNLNNGEDIENKDIIDINLNDIKAEYREKSRDTWGYGFKDKTKSKTFNFIKDKTLYSIPIIEIIRAVLAPNKFMLNRIVEMDTLENYFTHEIKDKILSIHFTSQYEQKLLKDEKINHLAWILTNSEIFRMFNSIGENLWEIGELKFDFLFEKFNIKARVEKKEKYVRVLQIVSLQKKRINVDDINITHPALEETEITNEVKKRKFIKNSGNKDRELDTSSDGSTKDSEEIDTFSIYHEYERFPRIKKVRTGRKIRRTKEDDNTEKFIFEDKGLRTTADTGGEDLVKGLEFSNLEKVEVKGELEEFIEVLKHLKERPDVKSVEIVVGELPGGTKGKKFSRLQNGFTKRKYVIGKLVMLNEKEICLIEVEREERSLSMIIMKSIILMNWKNFCSIMLLGLVNESGKWSNDIIDKVKEQGIEVIRKKHTSKSIEEREKQLYKSLTYL